ncbi:cation acetate symporter [Streptomyces sp. NPDC047130]|uniref:sodium/solute symporter n=1 Tax=Streptomyces sp. NPDC047130 TaxID=3155261 RepID=UPI00340E428E
MNDFSAHSMSLVAFCAVASLTLLLCVMTGPDSDDLQEFYTGYGALTPFRNGMAIAGDYVSAATMLGTCGLVAFYGYDGMLLALSTALSLLLLMLLLAEPLRNTGRFTLGDVLARRTGSRAVRVTICVVTLLALLPMMLVQLAGAGQLMSFILGFESDALETGMVVGLGVLMISYAAIGGMKGTAFIQIVKIFIVLVSGVMVCAVLLARFDWNPGALFDAAARGSGLGQAFLETGLEFTGHPHPTLDMLAIHVQTVVGAACLPHITMRMFTATSARQVRRSMSWAVSSVTLFSLIIIVVAFGAVALVGRAAIASADPQGNTTYLIGSSAALDAGGSYLAALLFTVVTTGVFLTLLASVAGMILACANSVAHDMVAARRPGLTPRREVMTARAAALGVGVLAVVLATMVQHRNLQPLVTLALSVSSSAIAPALVYSLFWRRFTRRGLLWSMIGGTAVVLLLSPFTNLVSGYPTSALPDHAFNWFPFTTTALVTIPVGFALGWIGTVTSPPHKVREQQHRYDDLEPRLLAGTAPH